MQKSVVFMPIKELSFVISFPHISEEGGWFEDVLSSKGSKDLTRYRLIHYNRLLRLKKDRKEGRNVASYDNRRRIDGDQM